MSACLFFVSLNHFVLLRVAFVSKVVELVKPLDCWALSRELQTQVEIFNTPIIGRSGCGGFEGGGSGNGGDGGDYGAEVEAVVDLDLVRQRYGGRVPRMHSWCDALRLARDPADPKGKGKKGRNKNKIGYQVKHDTSKCSKRNDNVGHQHQHLAFSLAVSLSVPSTLASTSACALACLRTVEVERKRGDWVECELILVSVPDAVDANPPPSLAGFGGAGGDGEDGEGGQGARPGLGCIRVRVLGESYSEGDKHRGQVRVSCACIHPVSTYAPTRAQQQL